MVEGWKRMEGWRRRSLGERGGAWVGGVGPGWQGWGWREVDGGIVAGRKGSRSGNERRDKKSFLSVARPHPLSMRRPHPAAHL